jgi:hypothetical protein
LNVIRRRVCDTRRITATGRARVKKGKSSIEKVIRRLIDNCYFRSEYKSKSKSKSIIPDKFIPVSFRVRTLRRARAVALAAKEAAKAALIASKKADREGNL